MPFIQFEKIDHGKALGRPASTSKIDIVDQCALPDPCMPAGKIAALAITCIILIGGGLTAAVWVISTGLVL